MISIFREPRVIRGERKKEAILLSLELQHLEYQNCSHPLNAVLIITMPLFTLCHLFLYFDQEGSTKQVNLLAAPQDRSLKVVTASIQDLFRWKQFEDKISVIYEIFGKSFS